MSSKKRTLSPPPHPSKRPKPTSSSSTVQPTLDAQGDPFFPLNAAGTRRITLSTFKSQTLISIREYYEKDGEKLPGKKGISLTVEQYGELVRAMGAIERVLGERGVRVARPDFGEVGGVEDDEVDDVEIKEEEEEEEEEEGKKGKANYEATSDEEE